MSAPMSAIEGEADSLYEAPGDRQGVEDHIGPESCALAREGHGEALTGERIGQPLSREKSLILGADTVYKVEGNMSGRDTRGPDDPAWSETLACADAPCAGTGRSRDRPFGKAAGPHQEGEEP